MSSIKHKDCAVQYRSSQIIPCRSLQAFRWLFSTALHAFIIQILYHSKLSIINITRGKHKTTYKFINDASTIKITRIIVIDHKQFVIKTIPIVINRSDCMQLHLVEHGVRLPCNVQRSASYSRTQIQVNNLVLNTQKQLQDKLVHQVLISM